MCHEIVRLQFDRHSESLDGVLQAVLLFQGTAQVDLRQDEIGCVRHRPSKPPLRHVDPAGLKRDAPEQPHCVDVGRVFAQDLAIELLRLFQATLSLMLCRQGKGLAFRVQCK